MDFEDTHCEPCLREDIKTEAIIYCYDCSEKLCEECKRHHKKSKLLKTHKLFDCASKLDMKDIDYFRQLSKCPKHNSEDVNYLCKDHDQLCCNECAIVTHRKCEDMVSLVDEVRGNEENGSSPNITKLLEDIMNYADMLIEHETGYQPGLDAAEKKVKSRMKKIKTSLDDAYSKLENKIMSEMSAKRKALNKASSLQEEAVENVKTEAKKIYDKMKRASEFGQQTQMFLMERETRTDVQKHEETLKTCHEQASNTVFSMTETKSMQDLSHTLSMFLYIEELSTNPALPPCPVYRDLKERGAVCVRTIDIQDGDYCLRYCLWIDNYLIVSLQKLRKLKLYDAQNGKLLSTYCCSADPYAMTAVEGSNFAVALQNTNTIDIMSVSQSQLKYIRTAVQASSQLTAIAYDKQNKQLIAASRSDGMLIKFHLDGRYAGKIRLNQLESNALNKAYNIVLDDKLNRIYISLYETHKLICVDVSGKRVFQYSHKNLKNPWSVNVDSDSNVYVVSSNGNCIQQLNKEGMFIREIISNGNDLVTPLGMCFNNYMSKFVVTCRRKGKQIQIYKFEWCRD